MHSENKKESSFDRLLGSINAFQATVNIIVHAHIRLGVYAITQSPYNGRLTAKIFSFGQKRSLCSCFETTLISFSVFSQSF